MLARILLTYRQFIFVTVYSHLLRMTLLSHHLEAPVNSLASTRSFLPNMVEMDEHLFHPSDLVCGAHCEL